MIKNIFRYYRVLGKGGFGEVSNVWFSVSSVFREIDSKVIERNYF